MAKDRDGEPDGMVKLNVMIPAPLLKRLKKRAIDEDIFLWEAVAKAVEQWLRA
jgi:hypothetical protein